MMASVRRIVVLVVLVVAAAVLAAPAVTDAQRRFRTIRSSGTILGHLAQPASPEGYAFAGFVSDSKLGEGATTAQGSIEGPTTSGAIVAFFDRGTVRGSFRFAITANPDGTITYEGTTRYRGGTGAYAGARGSGRTIATQDAEGYTRFDYTQTLKVPRR